MIQREICKKKEEKIQGSQASYRFIARTRIQGERRTKGERESECVRNREKDTER